MLADRLITRPTQHWLDILQPADVWCSEVMTWDKLLEHDGFKVLNMIQTVTRSNGVRLQTLRSPIRIDSHSGQCPIAAPLLGEHTKAIEDEFDLPQDA